MVFEGGVVVLSKSLKMTPPEIDFFGAITDDSDQVGLATGDYRFH